MTEATECVGADEVWERQQHQQQGDPALCVCPFLLVVFSAPRFLVLHVDARLLHPVICVLLGVNSSSLAVGRPIRFCASILVSILFLFSFLCFLSFSFGSSLPLHFPSSPEWLSPPPFALAFTEPSGWQASTSPVEGTR